jgi:hypothetical protein
LFFTPFQYFSPFIGLKLFFILCSCSPLYYIIVLHPLVYDYKFFHFLSLLFISSDYFCSSIGVKLFFILCSCSPLYQIYVLRQLVYISKLFNFLVLDSISIFFTIDWSKIVLYSLFLFSILSDFCSSSIVLQLHIIYFPVVVLHAHHYFSLSIGLKWFFILCSYSPFHPISGFHLLYWSTVIYSLVFVHHTIFVLIPWSMLPYFFIYFFIIISVAFYSKTKINI